jgi:hypothetical protein
MRPLRQGFRLPWPHLPTVRKWRYLSPYRKRNPLRLLRQGSNTGPADSAAIQGPPCSWPTPDMRGRGKSRGQGRCGMPQRRVDGHVQAQAIGSGRRRGGQRQHRNPVQSNGNGTNCVYVAVYSQGGIGANATFIAISTKGAKGGTCANPTVCAKTTARALRSNPTICGIWVPGRFKSFPAHMPPFAPQARELAGFRRRAPLEKMPPYVSAPCGGAGLAVTAQMVANAHPLTGAEAGTRPYQGTPGRQLPAARNGTICAHPLSGSMRHPGAVSAANGTKCAQDRHPGPGRTGAQIPSMAPFAQGGPWPARCLQGWHMRIWWHPLHWLKWG